MREYGQNKKAFTLAEVLITIGILAIVAVLTLPAIINNNRNRILTTQLKRNYSLLENAFQLMLANDMVENLSDTSVFRAINGTECRFSDGLGNCNDFLNRLSGYIKIESKGTTGDYTYRSINPRTERAAKYPDDKKTGGMIILDNGAMLMRSYFKKTPDASNNINCSSLVRTNGCYNQAGQIVIDVNGRKGPNIEGRDLFTFILSDKGDLIPAWSELQALYNGTDKVWTKYPEACGNRGKADAEKVAKYGSGCAARIIDNNWEMDY